MRSFSIEDAVTKLVVSLEELPSFTTTYRFLASCDAHMGRQGRIPWQRLNFLPDPQ
jgi:hypothetical protein